MTLSRAQQSLLRSLYTRHGRKKNGLCVAEGVRAVGELCAAMPDAVEFFVCQTGVRPPVDRAPVYEVSESVFSALSATVHGQGVLAVARIPAPPEAGIVPQDPYLLVLDRVGDPGNFGTICRTAKASGLQELWLTAGSVDPYGDKAIRSALGAQFSMKIRFFPDLDRLAEAKAENHSLSNLDALVEAAAEEGYIKQEDCARIIAFRNNPSDESWINK